MGQRKLTPRQIEHAKQAAQSLADGVTWDYTPDGDGYWMSVFDKLVSMAQHGTTDGKPWIEPQPEIGEGYRYAIESDVNRLDVERWDTKSFAWHVRDASKRGEPLDKEITYRVRIDRIPTDEDAKQRPTVMVRDNDKQDWQARKLLAVTGCLDKFITSSSSGVACFWMQARFPYHGELD